MRILLIAALIAGFAPAAPASAAERVRETRVATGFARIDIDGQADVTLRQGSSEGVTIEASAQALPRIRTEVRDGTLIISLEDQRHWWDWVPGGGSTRSPRITIDFTRLERIDAAGALKFRAETLKSDDLRLDFAGACSLRIGDLQAVRLRLDGSGAIKAELAGKVGAQYVDLSGAGSYQAADLASDSAVLQVSGAGKAVVNASTTLKVRVSGAGHVEYLGNPKLDPHISGAAKISRRESP